VEQLEDGTWKLPAVCSLPLPVVPVSLPPEWRKLWREAQVPPVPPAPHHPFQTLNPKQKPLSLRYQVILVIKTETLVKGTSLPLKRKRKVLWKLSKCCQLIKIDYCFLNQFVFAKNENPP
jgi:hypothetical protein